MREDQIVGLEVCLAFRSRIAQIDEVLQTLLTFGGGVDGTHPAVLVDHGVRRQPCKKAIRVWG